VSKNAFIFCQALMPSLGSHMSPNNGTMQPTFADLHDIHYAQNASQYAQNASQYSQNGSQYAQNASQYAQNASTLSFPVSATVHHSNYNLMDRPVIDPTAYNGTMTSQGPPGEPTIPLCELMSHLCF
jgi:hypothetical protein